MVNGVGATATGLTLLVVLVAKFVAGAWVTALLVPVLILLMSMVKRHYVRVAITNRRRYAARSDWRQASFRDRAARPLEQDYGKRNALCAGSFPTTCRRCTSTAGSTNRRTLDAVWQRNVAAPVKAAGLPVPQLVTLQSPYRFVILPLVDYVLKMEQEHKGRTIAVLVPELVVRHWWENLLHNQRAQLLKLLLLVKGNQGIVVLNIPWYLQK